MRRYLFLWLAVAFILGCPTHPGNLEPPRDHPYYPSNLLQSENTLYVFSSNFDRRFMHGSVISVDLAKVSEGLGKSIKDFGPEVVTSSGFIPSFADGAVFASKDQIVYLSREDNSLRKIPLSSDQIACKPGNSTLGQDCASLPAAYLAQGNPYFLSTFPALGVDSIEGIVGYALGASISKADSYGNFPLPQYFELERFTWNNPGGVTPRKIPLGDLLQEKNQSTSPGRARMNVKIGAMLMETDHLYMLVERPAERIFDRKSVLLVRVAGEELKKFSSGTIPIATYDISVTSNIESAGALAIRSSGDRQQIFALSEQPGLIVKLEIKIGDAVDDKGQLKILQSSINSVCDLSTDIKFTPDDKRSKLVVACNDGKVAVYDPETLALLSVDPPVSAVFGRGPVKIHFDQREKISPFRFYTANFFDGSIGIFGLNELPAGAMLTRLGRIFQPSPLNRQGGIE